MCDALSAERTVRHPDIPVSGDVHRRPCSGAGYIPYIQPLYLITNLNAAHTFDTLIRIPDQRKCFIPFSMYEFFFKWIVQYIKIICDLLKAAVHAPAAGDALSVML